MSKLWFAFAFIAFVSVSTEALAEEKGRGKVTLDGIVIQLPPMRPLAAVEVVRSQPGLPLPPLRQAFLDRVETAAERDPF